MLFMIKRRKMGRSLDVRPSSKGRLVDIILNTCITSWRELLVSSIHESYRIRIFTDPDRRAKQVKQFYWAVHSSYPALTLEALDYAFEMYLLGWIDPYKVVQVAREYDAGSLRSLNLF